MSDTCSLCNAVPDLRKKTSNEDGSFITSIHNLHVLISELGLPERVTLFHSDDLGGNVVTARWSYSILTPREHTFIGFRWGDKGGARSEALATFFSRVRIRIGLEEIKTWPNTAKRKLSGKHIFMRKTSKWVRTHVGGAR